ncbi:MAG: GxxExxY protein [Holophagaceae bacterium]
MTLSSGKDHRQDAKTPRKDLGAIEERLAASIVDAAIRVHAVLGPGLLEGVYETCLAHELETRGHQVKRQVVLPIRYDTLTPDAGLRMDMVIDDLVVLELKAVEHVLPVHHAQLLTYLKLSGLRLGFLLNFNVSLMKDGITRKILQSAKAGTPATP